MTIRTLFCLYLLLAVCNTLNSQPTTTIRIDPESAFGGFSSEIFDNVDFIPLETTKESTFGKIDQLVVTTEHFIILDKQTNALLIFKKNGKFVLKMRPTKADQYFSYFSIDKNRNEYIVYVGWGRFMIFDFEGKLLRNEKGPESAEAFFYFDKNNITYNLSRSLTPTEKEETEYDLVYSSGFNKIVKKLHPYNTKFMLYEYNLPRVFTGSQDNETCFFTFPYDYTVSQLDKNGMIHQYKFIFPLKYSLPQGFSTDSTYTKKRNKFVRQTRENFGKYLAITPVFKVKDYLLFNAQYTGIVPTDKAFLHNLTTGKTISFNKVVGDSITDFIPVLNYKFHEEMHWANSNYIYSSVPAFILFKLKESLENKIKYRPVLESFFSKGDTKANPVLIQAKLKEGL